MRQRALFTMVAAVVTVWPMVAAQTPDTAVWSTVQYDFSSPESIGRTLESRLSGIVRRAARASAASSQPIRVGVTPFIPRKITHVDPVYPPGAAKTPAESVVIVELRVDEEGRVADARVLRSGPPLDQAALDAVRQWRYEPLLVNGAPTPVVLSVVVNVTSRRKTATGAMKT